LAAHLASAGLADAAFADLQLLAFGVELPLHRLVLVRSPFFASLLAENGPWASPPHTVGRASCLQSYALRIDDPHASVAGLRACLSWLYGADSGSLLCEGVSSAAPHPLTDTVCRERL
jgi:hypothetical protein